MSLLRRGTCCTGVSDILEEICSAGSQAHGRALALALRTAGDTAADFSPALLLLRNFEALASSALGDPAHSGEDCPSIMAHLVHVEGPLEIIHPSVQSCCMCPIEPSEAGFQASFLTG